MSVGCECVGGDVSVRCRYEIGGGEVGMLSMEWDVCGCECGCGDVSVGGIGCMRCEMLSVRVKLRGCEV